MKRILSFIFLLLLLVTIVPLTSVFADSKSKVTETAAQIQQKYAGATAGGEKVRILIVPGHEPSYGGAVYQGVYEREITVEIADQLATYLNQNPRLDVIVARSNTAWNDDLQGYFDDSWDDIQDFVKDKKKAFQKLVKKGKVTTRDTDEQVDHAAAPDDVALRLYGIGKWADENDVDFVVHLHINDTTDHGPNDPSAYEGFTVYVPDSQYGNADTSRVLGEDIATHLSAMNATSTLPVENQGVVEDQELIAIGAYDTLTVPSALMEYSYITEPKFTQPEVRQTVTKDFAFETYLGIQDFLGAPVQEKFPTASLPFTFTDTPIVGSSSPAVYSLQSALHTIGFYPVATTTKIMGSSTSATTTMRTLVDCPISGVMDSCTVDGINAFQQSRGWIPTGALGPMTRTALNTLFSSAPVAPILPTPPAINPVSSSTTCTLPKNSLSLNDTDAKTDGDVSKLQTLLSKDVSVYPQKLVTGLFGPATQTAVQAFQVKQGIAKKGGVGYGMVGPKTLTALEILCK